MKAILLILGIAGSASLLAAPFDSPSFTIDGGGGRSTSADGRFALHGTIGQPDAGTLVSFSAGLPDGRFALEGGFWNSVVCNFGLRISHFRDDLTPERVVYVVITWPIADNEGCVLEATTQLHSDPSLNVWTLVPFTRAGEGFYGYSAPAGGPVRFFRLRAQ